MSEIVALAPRRTAPKPLFPSPSAPAYAELLATSNFSFLRSGSDPE
jgi:hypothetical protein